jgi:predicted NBD/HSP70 family sugar kinase
VVGPPTASSVIRAQNLSALLAVLRDHGPAARADVVARTGLSTPTVSAGLRAFEHEGVVREFGRTTGRRGPRASLYELRPDAVLVLGIDIGARHVRTVLVGLDGQLVEALDAPLARPRAGDVLDAVRSLPGRLGARFERVELAVVGTPGVVDPATGRVGTVPNLEEWEGILAADALGEALGVPVRVENDVNLAALGEQAQGAGRDVADFAYLSVGTGVGAGIVVEGRLHRGVRGAAGEVAFLPVGADPFDLSDPRRRGAMEAALSAQGVEAIAARLAGAAAGAAGPALDAESVFASARAGDPLGRAVALETARQIATCVAAITAVLDLELVLLGGGIGANADLLLPDVREAIAALVPAPPRVEAATLGERAVATGAVAVGLELALERLIERIVVRERPAAD